MSHLTREGIFEEIKNNEPKYAFQNIIQSIYYPRNISFLCDNQGNYFVSKSFIEVGNIRVPCLVPADRNSILEQVCLNGNEVMNDAYSGCSKSKFNGRWKSPQELFESELGEEGCNKLDDFIVDLDNRDIIDEVMQDTHENIVKNQRMVEISMVESSLSVAIGG